MAVGETYGVRWGGRGAGEKLTNTPPFLPPPPPPPPPPPHPPPPPLPPPRTISFTNSHGGLTLFRVVVENMPSPFREELFSLNNPLLWK